MSNQDYYAEVLIRDGEIEALEEQVAALQGTVRDMRRHISDLLSAIGPLVTMYVRRSPERGTYVGTPEEGGAVGVAWDAAYLTIARIREAI